MPQRMLYDIEFIAAQILRGDTINVFVYKTLREKKLRFYIV